MPTIASSPTSDSDSLPVESTDECEMTCEKPDQPASEAHNFGTMPETSSARSRVNVNTVTEAASSSESYQHLRNVRDSTAGWNRDNGMSLYICIIVSMFRATIKG